MGAYGRALVGIGLIALTACGSVRIDHKVAVATDYVPWLPLKASDALIEAPTVPPSPPYPIPAGTPSCVASQLEGVIGHAGGATGGNIDLPILFRDKGSSDCVVDGFPDVSVLDAAGAVLATARGSVGQGTYFDDGPVVPVLAKSGTPKLPVSDAGVVAKPGQLFINLSWYDCKRPKARTLLVDLPDGGGRFGLAFPVSGAYYVLCDTEPSYRALNRGPFSPAGIEWPPDLHRYIDASLTIDQPAPVEAGAPLVFYVTVSNHDSIEYVLDQCPDYIAFLGPKTVVMKYRLNCAPVGRIAPGASVKFQMKMDIPNALQAGDYKLSWSLIDFRIESDHPTAQVQVIA
jgi:uncharacterized protein DUF4232